MYPEPQAFHVRALVFSRIQCQQPLLPRCCVSTLVSRPGLWNLFSSFQCFLHTRACSVTWEGSREALQAHSPGPQLPGTPRQREDTCCPCREPDFRRFLALPFQWGPLAPEPLRTWASSGSRLPDSQAVPEPLARLRPDPLSPLSYITAVFLTPPSLSGAGLRVPLPPALAPSTEPGTYSLSDKRLEN